MNKYTYFPKTPRLQNKIPNKSIRSLVEPTLFHLDRKGSKVHTRLHVFDLSEEIPKLLKLVLLLYTVLQKIYHPSFNYNFNHSHRIPISFGQLLRSIF